MSVVNQFLLVFLIELFQLSGASSQFTPKILLFSQPACDGDYVKFDHGSNVPTLEPYIFNDLARSVYITGPWIFYELENFNEGIAPMDYIFESSPTCVNFQLLAGHVSSLRSVGDINNFRTDSLTLYATRDFQGEAEFISGSTEHVYSFGNQRSLIITGHDAWTIYDQPFFTGRALCLVPELSPDYTPSLIPNFANFKPPISIGSVASVRKGCENRVRRVYIRKRKFES